MRVYQLCRALSAIPVDHEKLSVILAEVADFRQPKVLPLLRLDVFSSLWLELCGWEDLIISLSIKCHDGHVVQRAFCSVFVVSYLCWLFELLTGYVSIIVSVPVHIVKPQDNGWGLITLISDVCGQTVMCFGYSTNMCLLFWQDLRFQTGFLF
jgi:hypothetical protein